MFIQVHDRDVHMERLLHFGDHLEGHQRIATEIKKIVLNSDARNRKSPLKDGCNRRFKVIGGWNIRSLERWPFMQPTRLLDDLSLELRSVKEIGILGRRGRRWI